MGRTHSRPGRNPGVRVAGLEPLHSRPMSRAGIVALVAVAVVVLLVVAYVVILVSENPTY